MLPSRRQFVTRSAAVAVMAGLPMARARASAAFAPGDPDWLSYKSRFVAADGRVVDTGNNGISHSEGQSYGMLFSVAFNDRPSFDLISAWTARHLTRRTDALHVWRYLPDQPDHTPDQNNATDGDLLIAMALNRAASLWGNPDNAATARAIARAIRERLIVNAAGRLVLLPGVNGFVQKTALIVNLSYYNFVALRELSTIDSSPLWAILGLDGLALMQAARFGRWQLPPDWLSVPLDSSPVRIAAGWPPLCSYDAIRVPLNLTWAQSLAADVANAFGSFWTTSAPYQPAWANLETDAVSSYAATGGLVAVSAVTMASAAEAGPPVLPSVQTCADYYSASLTLLSRIAWSESHGSG